MTIVEQVLASQSLFTRVSGGGRVMGSTGTPTRASLAVLDPSPCTLAAGDLVATLLPGRGMLVASLRHRGDELLGRVEDVAGAARAGSTRGIPLLYPWANRLGGLRYQAAGRTVELDPDSPLLHFDGSGMPIHGVPWAELAWQVSEQAADRVSARLNWRRDDLLRVFPFPHQLEMTTTLRPDGMTVETTLAADGGTPVPVSFGFHPYLRLPGVPRDEWLIALPGMRHLLLDARGLPNGLDEDVPPLCAQLHERSYDDGFALVADRSTFLLTDGVRRITVEFLRGFPFAQVFAPPGKDFVAFEPMTATTNALVTGRGLKVVEPGATFSAAFRIGVTQATPTAGGRLPVEDQ
jgi:aldose 1-epimerase